MGKKRYRVYLAGPISNCNSRQIHDWREELIDRFGREFDLVDPTDRLEEGASPYEIVHGDLASMKSADAVLANMWKESIGTAIGVAHAARHGKPVIVVDPNRLGSRALAYYATAVVKTPEEGMKRVKDYLKSRSHLKTVVKREGAEEPFVVDKLQRSIRKVCRAAGKDDVLEPAEILPDVLSRLMRLRRTPGKGKVTATNVREAVWEALRQLETDPLKAEHVTGIRQAWEEFHESKRGDAVLPSPQPSVAIRARALKLRIASNKSHASIWGHAVKELSAIPGTARKLFLEISRVEGIAEIRLTKKGTTSVNSGEGVRAEILASHTAHVIEGKCFDKARAGEVQFFQIRVHDDSKKEAIRRRLIEHLRERHLLRTPRGGA